MEILTNKKEHQRIKTISFELFKLNQKFKQQEQEYKAKKSELQNEIFKFSKKSNMTGFGYTIGNHTYSFSAVQPKTLVFDINKLKQVLDKSILNKIIKKEYTINNIEKLTEYLKSCGVDPKQFKKYLSIKETVDQKAINQLSELGELTLEQIKDCYEVHQNTGYVKISDWENEDEES